MWLVNDPDKVTSEQGLKRTKETGDIKVKSVLYRETISCNDS